MTHTSKSPSPGLAERLQALPSLAPPDRVWAAIAARRAKRARNRWVPALGLALAASLVMAVALITLEPARVVPGDTNGAEFTALAEQSRDLEFALAQLEPGSRVRDLQTAGTIIALEDRIASVDAHLQAAVLEAPQAKALMQQRVDLMQALVGVHVTSVQQSF